MSAFGARLELNPCCSVNKRKRKQRRGVRWMGAALGSRVVGDGHTGEVTFESKFEGEARD